MEVRTAAEGAAWTVTPDTDTGGFAPAAAGFGGAAGSGEAGAGAWARTAAGRMATRPRAIILAPASRLHRASRPDGFRIPIVPPSSFRMENATPRGTFFWTGGGSATGGCDITAIFRVIEAEW